MAVNIRFKRLHSAAMVPSYKTLGSSGADLHSVEDVVIPPGEPRLIRLGFAISMPRGYEIQVRPRSGLALKNQVTVLNAPGTVDSDYRGEMKVILANFSKQDFYVRQGDRIAQAVLCQVPDAVYTEVEDLDETARGDDGFGSTGVKN
jgi:dUTP pyrophosphatase